MPEYKIGENQAISPDYTTKLFVTSTIGVRFRYSCPGQLIFPKKLFAMAL